MKPLLFAAALLHSAVAIASEPAASKRIVLWAHQADGRDPVWQSRPRYGLKLWGIRGSGRVESGSVWFHSFPGESGPYRIVVRGVFEQDGRPFFQLTAGGRLLQRGRYPYLKGSLVCGGQSGPGKLDLGVHQIRRGDRIEFWGESVYECGPHGAYTFWERLVFIPEKK